MDALLSGAISESGASVCVKLTDWRWIDTAAANQTIYFSGTPYFAWGFFQSGAFSVGSVVTAFCVNVGETYNARANVDSVSDFSVTLNQTECWVNTSPGNQTMYIAVIGQR